MLLQTGTFLVSIVGVSVVEKTFRVIQEMTIRTRVHYVQVTIALLLTLVVALVSVDALQFDILVIGSTICLLLATEITSHIGITPQWRHNLRPIAVLSVVLVGILVARRLFEILIVVI